MHISCMCTCSVGSAQCFGCVVYGSGAMVGLYYYYCLYSLSISSSVAGSMPCMSAKNFTGFKQK